MNRYVCWLALLAVAAVPDWASAFNRRYQCGPVYPTYYEPLYFATPVYYPPPCVAVYVAPPPCVSTPAPAANPIPKTAIRVPKPMPATMDPVQPASGLAPISAPPNRSEEGLPWSAPPSLRGKGAGGFGDPPPKSPGLELPSATPSAAPSLTLPPLVAPDAGLPLIPSPVPPLSPDPKKTETLPPLVLPPETPPRTSRSSPVGAAAVRVFAASGAGGESADGLKKVVFFNHTDRDVDLTIDGKDVPLPAKSYINARLGASFRWKHGGGETETATIPADAAGLDVVFKD